VDSSDPIETLRFVYPRLLTLARMLSPRDPEDLVQDALVEVLSYHPGFEGITYPLGYSKAVMGRMASRRRFGRARNEPFLSLTELLDGSDSAIEWEEGVVSSIDVMEAMRRLGRGQRACVALSLSEALTDEQIGTLLEVSASTVRSQRSRGMAHLRELLATRPIDPGTSKKERRER
jgi:RNA polymerase sigma factor (sigma-70 family)